MFKAQAMMMKKTEKKHTAPTVETINTMTGWHPILRPIARVLVVAQLALMLQPLSVMAQEKGQAPFNPAAQAQLQRLGQWNQKIESAKLQTARNNASPADQVSDHLKQADELLKGLGTTGGSSFARNAAAIPSSQRNDQITLLKNHLTAIDQGTASVQAEFDATKAELKRKNLAPEIIARHDAAVAQFQQRSADFAKIAHKISNAAAVLDSDLNDLGAFFNTYPTSRKPAPLQPGKLPWSTPKPSTRSPAVTKTAWFQNFYADKKVQLAQGGSNIGPIHFDIPPVPGQAPTPADLAQTDEVQITPGIIAQAKTLNNNPVNIYNWVHNNIEFVPTAGAIQSAQDTLDKMRGNATDTASLLIALLRASNIPARYQYGTIDVAADKVQNWVGGTTVPEAALQILNTGGIAATGIASGGKIATIRMEHVWVNAYVNWDPAQGAKDGGWKLSPSQHVNPNGNLNAWVPLDASFKQYTYSAGIDLKASVPLDVNALLTSAQSGATVNVAQGWVQNLNHGAVQSRLNDYQTSLQNYINTTPTGANSTVGDINGKKVIVQQAQPLLAGTLQNVVVLRASEAIAVPAAQQHRFTYSIYASQTDQVNGNPMLSFTEKTSKLVDKRLTLSYVPATPADAIAMASYLPKPHLDGSPILPSEVPTSLPGYLFQLKPQLTLDGQVVASSGTSVQMGTNLYSTGGFTQLYDTSQWDLTNEESNVAGNGTAIGISAGGISGAQLTALKVRFNVAKTKLQTNNLTGLNGEQVAGDLLTATIWSWFVAAESHNRLSQNQANEIENPGLSYGLFHAVANPVYSWGVIREVTFPGVNMDIGHVRNLSWNKQNDPNGWIAYNRLRGQYMSALEHAVPERIFSDPAQCNLVGTSNSNLALPACSQGISTVNAISLAAQAGQKIYTITAQVFQNNPNIVTTSLSAQSQTTKDKIQQALDAGFEVSIHEAPVTQGSWTGAGFSIIDPNTGAGAYLIDGTTNGGWLLFNAFVILGLIGCLLASVLAIPGLIGLASYAFGFAIVTTAFINWDNVNIGQYFAILSFVRYMAIIAILGGAILFGTPAFLIIAFQAFVMGSAIAFLTALFASKTSEIGDENIA